MFKKIAFGAIAFVLPAVAGAVVSPSTGNIIPSASNVGLDSAGGFVQQIQTLTNWMFGLLLLLAVIFILWAAFKYLTAGGDEEALGKAKSILIYAIIAIAIAVLAKGIVALVSSFLGGSSVNLG
ncbi:MAG: hypothetical protein AAB503_00855 [Patescibacteria group bacterium]